MLFIALGEGIWGELEDEHGEGEEGRRLGRGEEGRGEGGLGGREEVGQLLELCHLVDETVDVGDVSAVGETDLSPHSGWLFRFGSGGGGGEHGEVMRVLSKGVWDVGCLGDAAARFMNN